MRTTATTERPRRLQASAWALVIFQLVHAITPADTDSESYLGPIAGLILLIAACAAVYGVRAHRSWAPTVTGWTGLVVAVGFILYHVLPFESPLTNPYLGEPVGPPAWISVALAVGAGAWAAYEGLARGNRAA